MAHVNLAGERITRETRTSPWWTWQGGTREGLSYLHLAPSWQTFELNPVNISVGRYS